MRKSRGTFKVVGVSKKKSITCVTEKQNHFWPNTSVLSQDRFDALWSLLSGNWEKVKATIEYDRLSDDGTPINPVFIELIDF